VALNLAIGGGDCVIPWNSKAEGINTIRKCVTVVFSCPQNLGIYDFQEFWHVPAERLARRWLRHVLAEYSVGFEILTGLI
jgi:hypothetical protein